MAEDLSDRDTLDYTRRHLRFGWWLLLCFLTLGIVLEAMHGFKVGWYMDVSNETRRLLWTLAHAHGVLLALVNIAFGLTLRVLPVSRWRRIGSPCLIGASVFLPMGFFLGGLYFFEGDPGVGIVLLPIGAVLLLIAVFLTACGVTSTRYDRTDAGTGE